MKKLGAYLISLFLIFSNLVLAETGFENAEVSTEHIFTQDELLITSTMILEAVKNKHSASVEFDNGLLVQVLYSRDFMTLNMTHSFDFVSDFFELTFNAEAHSLFQTERFAVLVSYPIMGHFIVGAGQGLATHKTYYEIHNMNDMYGLLTSPLIPQDIKDSLEAEGVFDYISLPDNNELSSKNPVTYFGLGVRFNENNQIYIQPGFVFGDKTRIDTIDLNIKLGGEKAGFIFDFQRTEMAHRVREIFPTEDLPAGKLFNYADLKLSTMTMDTSIFFENKNKTRVTLGFYGDYYPDFAKARIYVKSRIRDKVTFQVGMKFIFNYMPIPTSIDFTGESGTQVFVENPTPKWLNYDSHLFVGGGYNFNINPNFRIEPSGLLIFQGPNNFDAEPGKPIGGGGSLDLAFRPNGRNWCSGGIDVIAFDPAANGKANVAVIGQFSVQFGKSPNS
ncbi:MAG: hypothetical protein ABIA04_10200 [Pseudomonadota bacterium]